MKEDYLWDKSGEPDPEIQQLEEILGTLRYQPKPLRLAEHSPAHRGRNYLALLAIAATVVVAFLAGGLWLQTRSTEASIPSVAYVTPATPVPSVSPDTPVTPNAPLSVFQPASPKRHSRMFVKHDNQEAVAAKQQLMFALRLASEKLNDAYRRTQTPTQIKNQHRAG
jgi:cell division protein FtsN